jgi:hypothetical protein
MEITAAAPGVCKMRRRDRASAALRGALEEAVAAGMTRAEIRVLADQFSPPPLRRNADGTRGRHSSAG